MAKIAVGGWQHETNTFATVKADYAAFERADEWPPLACGNAMLGAVQGIHLPITGAIESLRRQGHTLVPLLWCSATPCSYVTEHAFETICTMLLEQIESVLPVDGIYLDLHGAMVCEHVEDGEGEILARIRKRVGNEIPISVSLDLHANVTQKMMNHASAMDIFRTYPHIDMGETGSRAAEHLHMLLSNKEYWFKAYRQTEFIIPLNWGCTLVEPAKSLYELLPNLIQDPVHAVSFACGFHLSDIFDAGPSVIAYASTQQAANHAADAMLNAIQQKEPAFHGKIWPAKQAVAQALLTSGEKTGPVILADTQDNPGGGGPGNTTGLLRELIDANADNTVLAVLNDPVTAAEAHRLGVGHTFLAKLGERSDLDEHEPLEVQVKVLAISDGQLTATGPMYKGARMTLGPTALLLTGDTEIVVSSSPVQTADQVILRHIGVEPQKKKLIALKSSVHFRNDFQEMAAEILVVSSPGPVYADPAVLRYKNLRPGIRRAPDIKQAAVKKSNTSD